MKIRNFTLMLCTICLFLNTTLNAQGIKADKVVGVKVADYEPTVLDTIKLMVMQQWHENKLVTIGIGLFLLSGVYSIYKILKK